MRFTIQRTSSYGELPLIAELPDFPVARLEGVNGIGKTVTVRLLELCSGQRLDLNTDQWVGFCQGLGTVEVVATNLVDCDSIKWVVSGEVLLDRSATLDPAVDAALSLRELGPEAPDEHQRRRPLGRQRRATPQLDWFDLIEVDGAAVASLEQVRRLLVVERIGGEAGLLQTIASYAEEQGELAASELEERMPFDLADDAGRLLEELEEVVRGVDGEAVRRREANHQSALAEVDEYAAIAEEVLQRANDLRHLRDLQMRIERQTSTAPELDERIALLDSTILALEADQATASGRIAELESAVSDTTAVKKELRTAERTYKSQNTRMANLAEEIAKNRRTAGVSADDDLRHHEATLRDRFDELVRVRDSVDARPALHTLIARLLPPLQEREAAGQGSQLLVSDSNLADGGLTVGETSAGLQRRRAELSEPLADDAADAVAERVIRAKEELEACRRLPELLKQFDGARSARSDAEEKQRQLGARLAEATAAQLEAEREARRQLSDAIVAAAADRAILQQQRDELGSEEELVALRRQLTEELGAHGVTGPDLEQEYVSTSTRAQAAHRRLESLREALREAEASLARAVAEVEAAIGTLNSEPFSWLSVAAVSIPEANAPLAERLSFLERLTPATQAAGEALAIRQLGPQIRAAVQQVVADLVGQEDLGLLGSDRVRRARDSLARYTSEQFDVAEVKDPLLGDGAREIRINLVERTLEWIDGTGQQHRRPLEGFSSGEQAFGLTQARLALASRASRAAANQLIALDEFGAFVSGQRLRALRTFLESWSHRRPGIQLLLILPARDFEDLARRAAPRERPRYLQLAEEMAKPGYIVESLGQA